jgi:hypothetical protein
LFLSSTSASASGLLLLGLRASAFAFGHAGGAGVGLLFLFGYFGLDHLDEFEFFVDAFGHDGAWFDAFQSDDAADQRKDEDESGERSDGDVALGEEAPGELGIGAHSSRSKGFGVTFKFRPGELRLMSDGAKFRGEAAGEASVFEHRQVILFSPSGGVSKGIGGEGLGFLKQHGV